MTDPRIQAARAHLAAALPASQMPPSVLVRDLSETRRLLAQLLDAIEDGADFIAASRGVLGMALSDAVMYREPEGSCPDCPDIAQEFFCEDHAQDADLCVIYRQLTRDLEIEL